MASLCVYIRVSSKKQNDGFSPAVQMQMCIDLIKTNLGQSQFRIYKHTDSAYGVANTNLLNLINHLKSGSLIMVAYLDRISRSEYYGINIWNRLQEKNITLISVHESFDSRSPGSFEVYLNAIRNGEHESQMISARVRNTLKYLNSVARRVDNSPVSTKFGMKLERDDNDKPIYTETEETPYIRRLLELITTAGSSVAEINSIISRYAPAMVLDTYQKDTRSVTEYLPEPLLIRNIHKILSSVRIINGDIYENGYKPTDKITFPYRALDPRIVDSIYFLTDGYVHFDTNGNLVNEDGYDISAYLFNVISEEERTNISLSPSPSKWNVSRDSNPGASPNQMSPNQMSPEQMSPEERVTRRRSPRERERAIGRRQRSPNTINE